MGEAIRTLQQMMPDMDPEVIISVLESHGGHMERAAESLLAMGSAGSPPARRTSADHSPSQLSLALSTPSQPMVSPREMYPDSPFNRTQAAPPGGSVQMEWDEMLAQSLQHEELVQAAEAHQEAVLGAYQSRSAYNRQGGTSSLVGAAVEGVSSTFSSIGSAAYSGLTSLLSSTPTFASCMPAPVREQDDRWGPGGESEEPSLPSGSGESPWGTRDTASAAAAATPPQDMRMASPARPPVSEEDRSAMTPSYPGQLVHRRGHHVGGGGAGGSVAKKDD